MMPATSYDKQQPSEQAGEEQCALVTRRCIHDDEKLPIMSHSTIIGSSMLRLSCKWPNKGIFASGTISLEFR